MVIANSIQELKTLEKRRQNLKNKKWAEGHITSKQKKEFDKLNKDAVKTKSLRRFGFK